MQNISLTMTKISLGFSKFSILQNGVTIMKKWKIRIITKKMLLISK
jgi:hypothetical protein